jgi:hypothetical protein
MRIFYSVLDGTSRLDLRLVLRQAQDDGEGKGNRWGTERAGWFRAAGLVLRQLFDFAALAQNDFLPAADSPPVKAQDDGGRNCPCF